MDMGKETQLKDAAQTSDQEYTIAEFVAVANSVFHASPDIVTAALKTAGVFKTTKSAAIDIVEKFRKREV